MSKAKTADGYIRVSRRGGREGEPFISSEVQRKKIAPWAKLHEVEVVAWWEEIDQSGAKLERPLFQQALERCERGESGGIIVVRLDRFARSAVDALTSIRRLTEAGARLVSLEANFDGFDADGSVRDRDPDLDRAAGVGANQGELDERGDIGGWSRRAYLGARPERVSQGQEVRAATARRAGRLGCRRGVPTAGPWGFLGAARRLPGGEQDRKSGERYPIYYCTGRYAKGLCQARASGRASLLDAHVETQVLAALQAEGGLLAQAVAASEQIDSAARALDEAEHELDLFINNPKLITLHGEHKFLQGPTRPDRAHTRGPTRTNARPIAERAQIVLRGNVLVERKSDEQESA